MYHFEIKNDLALGHNKYAGTLKKYLASRSSKLNDEQFLKEVFLQHNDAYSVIEVIQKYGY